MICRMCLLDSPEFLKIFSEENQYCRIATTIAQHFWFEPKDDDPISDIVCCSCWLKIESFHIYYMSVEETHRKLSERFSVKQESLHTDTGIQVYLKVESSKFSESEEVAGDNEDEETVIEVIEEGIDGEEAAKESSYDCEDGQTLVDIVESMEDDCLEETPKEPEIRHETERSENTLTPVQEETCRSKYIEAQKNLQEFIKIEAVNERATAENNEKCESDSDDEPLIKLQKRKRKNLLRESASKRRNKSKPKDSKESANEYLLKSKEDDMKIAQNMKLKCDLCGSEHPTFADVKRHYRDVHKRKGYVVCCNKRLYKRVLILDHVNKHLNPEHFKCYECNKVFADKQCLKYHMMIRHESDEAKLFCCDECPRKFPKQYLLDQHKFRHTPEEERQYFCQDCGKAFSTSNFLQTHRKYVHENTYAHMCHICAKVIRGKKLFEKHQLEHAGMTEPKVQCHICGAWLKNKQGLRKHLIRHQESTEDHVCNVCGKVAPSRSALRSHIHYVHSSERSFKCSICDKGFKKAIVLKEHMTTHTGEVLYTCPHCPKTFNSHANMHAHRKQRHRQEWEEGRRKRGEPENSPNKSSSNRTNSTADVCKTSINNLNSVVLYGIDVDVTQ